LQVSVRNALNLRALEGELNRIKHSRSGTLGIGDVITKNAVMQSVLRMAEKAAGSNIPVLVAGESGVGKELIARAIHGSGERRMKPFVAVNCGAMPENLIESILFGHEKGSFTGATDKHLGKFQEADGGTLFLDEIGELRIDMQVKLLRALQEGEVDPVGSKRPVKVDVRIISATNRDLADLTREGQFREDLYYRLNVFPIEMPPLRERKDDILMLVEYFVQRYAKKAGKSIRTIEKKTLERLRAYDWPGNIRELQNVIERSVILSSGEVFAVDDVWFSNESPQATSRVATLAPSGREPRTEREIIEAALVASRGRVSGPSGAAAKLQIPPSTLEHKIRALKIRKSQFKFG